MLLGLLVTCPLTATASATAERVLHLLDYINVDYPYAVQGGAITNATGYTQQKEFASELKTYIRALPDVPGKSKLVQDSAELSRQILARADSSEVITRAGLMKLQLLASYPIAIAPRQITASTETTGLFRRNCAPCHGAIGMGNGPSGAGMDPPPINFHARDRQMKRSVTGLYHTISLGVECASMPAFTQLTDQERWRLAFFVSSFMFSDDERLRGTKLWENGKGKDWFPNLEKLTMTEPRQALATYGSDGLAVMAYLRSHPEILLGSRSAIPITQARVAESVTAYQLGHEEEAYRLAVAAYVDGFKAIEPTLDVMNATLRRDTAEAIMALRDAIRQRAPIDRITLLERRLNRLLEQAEQRLDRNTLSFSEGFLGALELMTKEGFPVVLIIATLLAGAHRMQSPTMPRLVHVGWSMAVIFGLLSWITATFVLELSTTQWEITVASTALISAALIFGAGAWMLRTPPGADSARPWLTHRKSNVILIVLGFTPVFHTTLDTLLAWESLWLQTGTDGGLALITAFTIGLALLAGMAMVVMRTSAALRLPSFIWFNAAVCYLAAIIFAGQGSATIQEAGLILSRPVDLPRFEWLGIYPSAQSTLLQGSLLAVALASLAWRFKAQRR